jgi:hypothetical protein
VIIKHRDLLSNNLETSLSQENIGSYSMALEVYLQSAIVRGILVTNQDRLSNYLVLREGEEVFAIREARLTDLQGKTIGINADHYLIYMRQVFAIADLSPQSRGIRTGFEQLYVKKDQSRALLAAGPFLFQGNVHVVPGGSIQDLLTVKPLFIPITEATMVNGRESEPRTYLINRTQIGCLAALRDE